MLEQDLKSFIERVKQQNPMEVVHVHEEINPKYEISTLIMELEKARRYPLTIFENVKGHDISVVTNVLAPRERLALAMDVHPNDLAAEFSKRLNM